jgi:ABC-type multidrug transport system fused ATPase/permease subunit
MRSFGQLWPTLKRLLAYGSPWRKQLAIAVVMLWVAAAAEVSGPLLISYFIDNMVAKNNLPLAMGRARPMSVCNCWRQGCITRSRCCLTRRRLASYSSCAPM